MLYLSYALDDVRTPATLAVLSIALNYALNWTFLRVLGWGHAGLAASTSLVATLNYLGLFLAMRSRLDGIHGRRLGFALLRIAICAAAMGLLTYYSSTLVQYRFGEGFLARCMDLAVSVPLGATVFYSLCSLMKVPDLTLAVNAFGGPVMKFIRRSPYANIWRGGV